ncbi:MAG TPA: hypothetical protein VLJ17_11650 [Xanthobacteraceae bacterium]|nr:hypothetical protein [Xanthobacteraceae bacterium]
MPCTDSSWSSRFCSILLGATAAGRDEAVIADPKLSRFTTRSDVWNPRSKGVGIKPGQSELRAAVRSYVSSGAATKDWFLPADGTRTFGTAQRGTFIKLP